jgi:aminoglycoside phosphotransferase family enzyme/predicted kinase
MRAGSVDPTAGGEERGAEQAAVVAAMRDARFYPHGPAHVEEVETHISHVFLAGERAYKLKKPVVLPFLDYASLERRRRYCEEEVRLNRRLAPDAYLGVRSIARADGGLRLAEPDAPGAVEYAVEMRRLPTDRSLERLVRAGEVGEEEIEQVAETIVAFHHGAAPAPPTHADDEAIKERLDENLRTTLRFVGAPIPRDAYSAVERFWDAFVLARRDLLLARAARGRVREGHGDLRAEHVVLEPDRVTIYDCVEFDERLRQVDVASDLAFLYMDLERLGASGLAGALVRAYVDRSGDRDIESLLPFYASYRAWVRAKAACLRAEQLQDGDPRADALREDARSLCELARRMTWRSRLPLVVVLCGVAASGKSTLARALSHSSGYVHLSSDAARKRLAGLAPSERGGGELYREDVTLRTYEALARGAREHVERGEGAIVDATYRRQAWRRRLLETLAPTGARTLFIECRAPAGILEGRAGAREESPEGGSDATRAVVAKQLGEFEPLDDVAPHDHLPTRTDRPPSATLEAVETFVSLAVDVRA